MRIFSYRNKTRLKSGLVVLLVLAAALLLLVSGIFIYLQRFIVYSADGVHLDFSSRPDAPDSTSPEPDGQNWVLENASGPNSVNLEIQDNVPSPGAATQLTGVYITTAMLSDPAAVEEILFQEEFPKTVLMDMKSIFGNFYYATSFPGATTASVDLEAVASIVSQLKRSGVYLIARIPAFSDNTFALANQDCGLALSSGALWMDSNGCYWLNPADDLVVYLSGVHCQRAGCLGL